MYRRIPVSFVGPVVQNQGKKAYFELLAAEGGVLRLEYSTADEANRERRNLGNPTTSHLVPTQELFNAIKQLVDQKESAE